MVAGMLVLRRVDQAWLDHADTVGDGLLMLPMACLSSRL